MPRAAAASAKRTTPYMPSWSVMARASNPNRAASSTSSSGWDAPSRKLKFEWQCSSAYDTRPRSVAAGGGSVSWDGGSYGRRLRDQAGLSPPSPPGGWLGSRPSDSRASSSAHGTFGLLHPTPLPYRTYVLVDTGEGRASPAHPSTG